MFTLLMASAAPAPRAGRGVLGSGGRAARPRSGARRRVLRSGGAGTLVRLRRAFTAGAGQEPPAWAIHPYRDLTDDPVPTTGSVEARFAAAVAPAPVWLTEVTTRLSGRGGIGGDPAAQLARGSWLRTELVVGRCARSSTCLRRPMPRASPRAIPGDSAIADRQGRARPFICGLAGLPARPAPAPRHLRRLSWAAGGPGARRSRANGGLRSERARWTACHPRRCRRDRRTVVEAFAEDPAWAFMIGGDDDLRERFARTLLWPRLARGTVWVAGEVEAVAMWDRRSNAPAADEERRRLWAAFRGGRGRRRLGQLGLRAGAWPRSEPARPYWYLGVLATRPAAQGRGLATRRPRARVRRGGRRRWTAGSRPPPRRTGHFYERRASREPTRHRPAIRGRGGSGGRTPRRPPGPQNGVKPATYGVFRPGAIPSARCVCSLGRQSRLGGLGRLRRPPPARPAEPSKEHMSSFADNEYSSPPSRSPRATRTRSPTDLRRCPRRHPGRDSKPEEGSRGLRGARQHRPRRRLR